MLDYTPELNDVWVKGEISNLRCPSSGHRYFTLKDDMARIRCVLFRGKGQRLQFDLADGLTVIVRGSVSMYEAAGDIQLYVEEMLPAGLGALHLAFEQLKEKLQKEGLFDQKRPLPYFPRRVGVITSPTGAAVRDMLSVLRRRNPTVHVLLIPAVVQGEAAPESICRAFELAGRQKDLDVILFGRGGGSLEELWAFNDERVARAIYRSPVPTISAVGHEIDYTIADFVADCRAPTPSAAAELAVPEWKTLKEAVEDLRHRSRQALIRRVDHLRQRLKLLTESAARRSRTTESSRLISVSMILLNGRSNDLPPSSRASQAPRYRRRQIGVVEPVGHVVSRLCHLQSGRYRRGHSGCRRRRSR